MIQRLSRREKITYATLILNVMLVVFLNLRGEKAAEIALILAGVDAPVVWYLQKESTNPSKRDYDEDTTIQR